MNKRWNVLITGLVLSLLFLQACTATSSIIPPKATPIMPTSTPIPPTPTLPAGMGIPDGSGSWQITLVAVRTADSLKIGAASNESTFTPKEGFAFLIIDTIIRNLDPTRAYKLTGENVAILDANQTIHTADGGGKGTTSICAGCSVSISKEVGKSELSLSTIITSGGRYTINFSTISPDEPISFLFVVKSEELNQEWRLQFKDIPPITFKLGDTASYPLSTEAIAQPSSLPTECQVDQIQSAQLKTGLVYQDWVDNTLITRWAPPDGTPPVELCKGFAYSSLKSAPDGALLLMAGNLHGWASLLIIEPGGKVTSLVRNALAINSDFIPGTQKVIVSVTQVGKDGKELYLYDRGQGALTLLYDAKWLNYRLFTNGNLLVNGMLRDTTEQFVVMGSVSDGELPALVLPKGANRNDITPDGKYLLYTDYQSGKSKLFLSNLDGSEQKEISGDGVPGGTRVLSPDGKYLLGQVEGTAKGMNQVALYELATGSAKSITPDSNSITYNFSPDGQWIVVINTYKREKSDELKTKKQVLYLFSMADQKVVKEVEGEIVNYFFSPDNADLAYTLKNEDETLSIFTVKLMDISTQPAGQGLLAGWSAGE